MFVSLKPTIKKMNSIELKQAWTETGFHESSEQDLYESGAGSGAALEDGSGLSQADSALAGHRVKVKNVLCGARRLCLERMIAKLHLPLTAMESHGARFARELQVVELDALDALLRPWGMETVRETGLSLVDQIKLIVADLVVDCLDQKDCLSEVLVKRLKYNYSYLSDLFSKAEGTTIRDFAIGRRIERAKEMLLDNGKDLLEISVLLNYCSVAHLASQFKKVTGMTMTEYRRQAREMYQRALSA